MPNYQNSKIYVLRSHQTEKIYIGSTVNELRKRFHSHKRQYKCFLENKSNYVSSYEILKYDDCYIELFEKYPCSDKMELHKREGEIIRSLDCVNKIVAGRTIKEWRKDNIEKIKQQRKEYNFKNKEKIKQQNKEWMKENKDKWKKYKQEWRKKNRFVCVCGVEISKENKTKHEKTKKHIDFINN
jgi:hypothetical protein